MVENLNHDVSRLYIPLTWDISDNHFRPTHRGRDSACDG